MTTINLEKFVSDREVVVTFRDGTAAKGTLERREFHKNYPYFFGLHHYSVRGEILIDREEKKDILDVRFIEESPVERYKKLADKLYHALRTTEKKAGICYNEAEDAKKEYESLQPKMTKYGCGKCTGEMFCYGEKNYALFYENWYALHCDKIYLVDNESLVARLDSAYETYKKTQ